MKQILKELYSGLTTKQKLILIYFSISIAILCITADGAPLWFLGIATINFIISAHFASQLPISNDDD